MDKFTITDKEEMFDVLYFYTECGEIKAFYRAWPGYVLNSEKYPEMRLALVFHNPLKKSRNYTYDDQFLSKKEALFVSVDKGIVLKDKLTGSIKNILNALDEEDILDKGIDIDDSHFSIQEYMNLHKKVLDIAEKTEKKESVITSIADFSKKKKDTEETFRYTIDNKTYKGTLKKEDKMNVVCFETVPSFKFVLERDEYGSHTLKEMSTGGQVLWIPKSIGGSLLYRLQSLMNPVEYSVGYLLSSDENMKEAVENYQKLHHDK